MLTQKQDTPTAGVPCFSVVRVPYSSIVPSPPISAVISRIRSRGNGGSQRGFIAMDISFIGLSSAATRLESSFRSGGSDGQWPTRRPSAPRPQRAPSVRRSPMPCRRAPRQRAGCTGNSGNGCGGHCLPLGNHNASAVPAGEHLVAGVCFIITLFKCLAFIFTIHD